MPVIPRVEIFQIDVDGPATAIVGQLYGDTVRPISDSLFSQLLLSHTDFHVVDTGQLYVIKDNLGIQPDQQLSYNGIEVDRRLPLLAGRLAAITKNTNAIICATLRKANIQKDD